MAKRKRWGSSGLMFTVLRSSLLSIDLSFEGNGNKSQQSNALALARGKIIAIWQILSPSL